MWVDNEGAQRIVRALEATVAALSKQLSLSAIQRVDTSLGQLRCPECDADLIVRHIAKAVVDVDLCGQHGTWFDAGELDRVIHAFHPSAEGEPSEGHKPEPLPEVDEELLHRELETWNLVDDGIADSLWKVMARARPRRRGWTGILP